MVLSVSHGSKRVVVDNQEITLYVRGINNHCRETRARVHNQEYGNLYILEVELVGVRWPCPKRFHLSGRIEEFIACRAGGI